MVFNGLNKPILANPHGSFAVVPEGTNSDITSHLTLFLGESGDTN
jgi:hypothetical protein